MELALVLQELLRRRRALAVGALVALTAALMSVYRPDGFGLASRGLTHSSAGTELFVDTHSSVLGDVNEAIEPLQARASTYANFMASPTMLALIGKRAGIAGDRLYAAGPVDPLVPRVVEEPTAVVRNVQITGEAAPYRLNFSNDPNLPTIGIAAQAPTTAQAVKLADAAAWALRHYVSELQASNGTPLRAQIVIRQLGPAIGGVSDAGVSKALATIVFLVVLVAWCVGMLLLARFAETWRAAAQIGREQAAAGSESGKRRQAAASEKGASRRSTRERDGRGGARRGGDDVGRPQPAGESESKASRNGRAKHRVHLPAGEP